MQIGKIEQLTTNPLPISIPKKVNKFIRLSPECGDWEAWYLNGKLIAEGHRVRVEDILDALNDIFPNTYNLIEISDEKAEIGFTEDLKSML